MAFALKTAVTARLARPCTTRRMVVVRAEQVPTPAETTMPTTSTTPAEEMTGGVQMPTPVMVPSQAPTAVVVDNSFGAAMAFAGPAPEIINGRLAMLGFVAALGSELVSGESVMEQLSSSAAPIALTFVAFTVASLIPILKGAKLEAFGPLTPKAEILNGQAAMIGFAFLLMIEALKGTALF